MANLQQIPITEQIRHRPERVPDYAAEISALRALARELDNPAGDVLKRLCEHALDLCHAHSAGISLVGFEGTENGLRWHAVTGQWSHHVGGGLPRSASLGGVVIDLKAAQPMNRPGQVFPLVAPAEPEFVEALLAPFKVMGECVGTVWILSRDETRKFDSEDVRVMESLASFAAAAFTIRDTLGRSLELDPEMKRSNARLNRLLERSCFIHA